MSNEIPCQVPQSADAVACGGVHRGTRAWVVIPFVAGLHLVLFVMVLLRSFGEAMRSFDTGAPPSRLGRLCVVFTEVLGFPALQLSRWLPGGWGVVAGWLLVIGNSLFWGWAVWRLGHVLRQWTKKNRTGVHVSPVSR